MLNAMHGLSLLFLVWPFVANAATLPFSVHKLQQVTTTPKILKIPILSKLVPVNPLAAQPSTKSRDIAEVNSNATTRNALLKVVTSVQCGNNQTFNDVLVDTGSAILWVGAESPYVPGPNTVDINSNFSVGYGIGGVQGPAYRDTVIIGQATGAGQIIGAATIIDGFKLVNPIDGILGLGPSGSNSRQVTGFNTTPTFVETLVAQKQISASVFGIYITPVGQDGTPEGTGEITFGGIDQSKIQGSVVWVPQNAPVNMHWEFNVSSFSFGTVSVTGPTYARTDTGLLDFGLPFNTFFDMRDAYNGTIISDGSALHSLLAFNSSMTPFLPNIDITIGSETFSIPPSRYTVPREAYSMLHATDVPNMEKTWLGSAGPGMFNLGQKFLESVYTAYDMDNHRVGFAHTSQS